MGWGWGVTLNRTVERAGRNEIFKTYFLVLLKLKKHSSSFRN